MNIVIKKDLNIVVGVYNDETNVKTLYDSNYKILNIPNNLRYDVPIIEEINDDHYGDEIKNENRYTIGADDINPINNTVNFSLNNRKLIACVVISEEVNQYIQYKPVTGEVRYTQAKQSSFTDIDMYCKQWLIDNPSESAETKALYSSRITAITSARTWIRNCLNYYYDYITLIRTATEENWATATAWDFSTFDASDPDVWLETVRLLNDM